MKNYNCKCYLEFREPKQRISLESSFEVSIKESELRENNATWEAFSEMLDNPDAVFELPADAWIFNTDNSECK